MVNSSNDVGYHANPRGQNHENDVYTARFCFRHCNPCKSASIWTDAPGSTVIAERRKPRVKGGSGCDDPGDIIEHPECR